MSTITNRNYHFEALVALGRRAKGILELNRCSQYPLSSRAHERRLLTSLGAFGQKLLKDCLLLRHLHNAKMPITFIQYRYIMPGLSILAYLF